VFSISAVAVMSLGFHGFLQTAGHQATDWVHLPLVNTTLDLLDP
jgi:hypothetical protein